MRRILLFPLLGVLGCEGDRPDAWDRARELHGPIPLKDRVAYVDGVRDRVVIVDASTPAAPRVSLHRVGRRALAAVPTPDRRRLAIVTRGHEALRAGEVDEAPGLYLVDVENPEAPPIRYEIGSPFDRLAIAADGRVAVAYFSEGGPDSEGLFRNPNELAIVDLEAPPSDENPVLRTVRSFGSAPTGVVLSPPLAIPGIDELRTMAFVFAPNTLTILDATRPRSREITVRLSLSSGIVRPRELAFAPQAGAAYLRADGARDVLQVLLSAEPPSDPSDNDFRAALAELGAGAAPADVAVYDDALGVRRVLAATPGTREIAIIDADTAQFVKVSIGDPIDRILLLPSDAPRLAVLASIATRAPRVHLLDLQRIGQDLWPPNVRTLALSRAVFDVVPVPGTELTMIVHDDARTVLGMLDASTAAVAPIEGAGRLDAYDFAAGRYLVGATRGVARVGVVDLGNLHPEDVRLDAEPAEVFALASGGIYVDHGGPFGLATILPSAGAGRREAIVFSGFLVAGLLDEEL